MALQCFNFQTWRDCWYKLEITPGSQHTQALRKAALLLSCSVKSVEICVVAPQNRFSHFFSCATSQTGGITLLGKVFSQVAPRSALRSGEVLRQDAFSAATQPTRTTPRNKPQVFWSFLCVFHALLLGITDATSLGWTKCTSWKSEELPGSQDLPERHLVLALGLKDSFKAAI